MTKSHNYCRASYFLLLFITAGCASQSGWETQSASPEFVNGTRILAEVVMITTRDESLSNKGLFSGWQEKLKSAGYTDNDIVDGSEVSLWSYCYGWNSGVSTCAHHGHYVAHVPKELRGKLKAVINVTGETSGDLVEVELNKTPTGHIVGKVVSLFRKSGDWSPCHKTSLQLISEASALLSTLVGIGPARAEWIECEEPNAEGWIRRPILRGPQSAGPPISEWVKLPL
jgi:hypothetical protein